MDLKDIEQALASKAEELEVAKTSELKTITERLALLNEKEEARQKEIRDAQKAATDAAVRRRCEQQELEQCLQREETEKRVLEEQLYSRKQTALEIDVRTTEQLVLAVTEQQHIEELVRETLTNSKFSVRKTIGNDGEQIMPNPLARFLQKEPD